jgi:hypothetical protein
LDEVSVNVTIRGASPLVGLAVKPETAGGDEGFVTVTYPARTLVEVSSVVFAVRNTPYVPGFAKVWTGFCTVAVPPSPKCHDHDVGVPLYVRSEKVTSSGVVPERGVAEKSAVSGPHSAYFRSPFDPS